MFHLNAWFTYRSSFLTVNTCVLFTLDFRSLRNIAVDDRFRLNTVSGLVCETLSLTLREEPRLRMFENRVLRRIFGLKTDEVT
jgi:hypothetical protein